MSLTSLECQVSELVNSDTCARPTTQLPHRLTPPGTPLQMLMKDHGTRDYGPEMGAPPPPLPRGTTIGKCY